ncbi:unnamed protein product, partial [Prorocentrum cordatum]
EVEKVWKPHAESSNNTSEVLVRIVLSWPWSGDYAHGVGKVSPKAEAPSVQGSPLGPLSEDQSYTPPPQQAGLRLMQVGHAGDHMHLRNPSASQ